MAARQRRGREEPADLVGDQPPADPVAVAREIVLRQLDVRARTRDELERALAKKGVPHEAGRQVLDRFTELGLVDDAAFAEQWVEGQQRRMKSRRVLRQELRHKGVDGDIVDEALSEVGEADDYAAALAYGRRKAAGLAKLEPAVRYRRLMGALARRGFSSAVSHRVYREVTGDQPDDELG
ncbi:regulatory protein RecX [Nigerium massiliense]|uniref:regulatory protein RecX n=1 Tax=Nigerium massiliense TaxID=1522317 RepID=UPI00058AE761|nr:regulatory protein RecX [Nigerium massiliense]